MLHVSCGNSVISFVNIMADEDEIDVLGDSNLNNFLSKSDVNAFESSSLISQNTDLLNCEYTIHPQWLLDKPSTNPDNWYNTITPGSDEKSHVDNDTLGHVSTENCISDESGWTEKEKDLLERGIEIFGKSNVRLSQFIGSKTSAEVRYYLKNFYVENHPKIVNEDTVQNNIKDEYLDEQQIPASIEEVIAAVSTGKPTVSRNIQKVFKNCAYGTSESFNECHSNTNVELLDIVEKRWNTKIRNSGKRNRRDKNKMNVIKVKLKSSKYLKFKEIPKSKPTSFTANSHHNNLSLTKEITTGKGLAVPISEGEEIVKLVNAEDEDLDVDVDVDLSDESNFSRHPKQKSEQLDDHGISSVQEACKSSKQQNASSKKNVDPLKLNEETLNLINSTEVPKCEMILVPHNISPLEKVINWDYFDGGNSKSPQRYLKIRSHMINLWLSQKPKYLHKTSSRQGLKNCGDVKDIGRIHQFLEQIGVINFGCEQVKYIRPLSEIIYTPPVSKEKNVKDIKIVPRPVGELGVRQRIKKKFVNDGEGGLTLTHDEKGEVIHTTVVNEEPPPVPKPKLHLKNPSVRLIYCRPFTDEKPQTYSIKMHLSSILTMDFHAHLSVTEVMGLVAGYWIPQNNSVIITHYEPCLNIASSSIHCDMCPISQAKAADAIHEKGLDILGWFHTHPTFAPEPSQQDLETQQTLQQWIGNKKPCVGVILSPFSSNGALIASPYRCLIVDTNSVGQLVPYRFNVDIIADNIDTKVLLASLVKVRQYQMSSVNSKTVDFEKPYFLDTSITHLEKYITSVRMHLAKNGKLKTDGYEDIIQDITNLFTAK